MKRWFILSLALMLAGCVSMQSLSRDESLVEITKTEPPKNCRLLGEVDSLDGHNFWGCSDNYACLKRAGHKKQSNYIVIDVAVIENLKGRAYQCGPKTLP